MQDFFHNHTILCIYLLGINSVTFVAFAADKIKAIRGSFRIRESVLLGLSAIGGAAGALLAMLLCRHKIRKPEFMLGVPVLFLVWLLVILLWFKIIII